jgi:hypothetical protein
VTRNRPLFTDVLRGWIDEASEHLVDIARAGFRREGRGCIFVTMPKPNDTSETTPIEFTWYAAAAIPFG